jgi:hypothetical protein
MKGQVLGDAGPPTFLQWPHFADKPRLPRRPHPLPPTSPCYWSFQHFTASPFPSTFPLNPHHSLRPRPLFSPRDCLPPMPLYLPGHSGR